MLQIYVYGEKESGYIDLYPDTILQLESVTDIFDEDLSAGEFSLPGKAPWSDTNRRILNFAERLQNNSTGKKDFKCIVYDSGYPELPAGKLTLIGKAGNFNYTKGNFDFTITGSKGLFGSQIKNKKLSDLTLGGKISWEGMDSRQFAEAHMKGSFPGQYTHLTFVPVAIENYFDTGRKDYDGEFLAKDTVNTVVITGSGNDAWSFGRPKSAAPSEAAVAGTEEYADYRTVPFLKTTFILRKIFEEHGYKVSGPVFDDPAYAELTTYNQFSIEKYSPNFYDFNRNIFPADHVPSMLIIDFLKGILGALNMYPTFSDSEVRIHMRKDFKKGRKVLSLTGFVSPLFSAASDESEAGSGYKINYNWNGDNYQSDRVKDLKDKIIIAHVGTISDLETVNIGRQMTTDDLVYVAAENMYYQVADATVSPIKWDCYAEALGEFTTPRPPAADGGEGNESSTEILLSTLCNYVEMDEGLGLLVKRPYLGTRMTGSYLNNKGVRVNSDCPNKIFFAGKKLNTSLVLVPVSWNHNRNAENERTGSFSLSLTGDFSLVEVFHKEWQEIKQGMEPLKMQVSANRKVLADMDEADFVEINGCHFIVKNKEREIPVRGMVEVELVVG